MTIEVVNEQSRLRVDRKRTEGLIRRVLKGEKAGRRDVTLLITDDKGIRKLNRDYLRHDRATDVIAFNAGEKKYLGDVVVSAETAVRESTHYGTTPKNEFERYVVHGLLHLLGYRDKKPADYKKMNRKQEGYLR